MTPQELEQALETAVSRALEAVFPKPFFMDASIVDTFLNVLCDNGFEVTPMDKEYLFL